MYREVQGTAGDLSLRLLDTIEQYQVLL